MEYVAADDRNPFGMSPPCERYVPGYGATTADFHVIGDHPGVHGGLAAGVPFTGEPWSDRFFDALARGGLVELSGEDLAVVDTFLSYLHMCAGNGDPDADSYAAMEPFFDAELRAITAHVLVPVGARATAHVFDSYTARDSATIDMDGLHATEVRGSGWLVLPVKDPAEWTDAEGDRFADALVELRRTDYRQESDLGRFFPGDDPYLVR